MNEHQDLEGIPKAIWSMVQVASHRLLIVDYDGTLAPFKVARQSAIPNPRSMECLRRIAASGGTQVAITSGRPVEEVRTLVGDLPAILIGESGWEYQLPGEVPVRHPLPPEASQTLDHAERLAIEAGWAEQLERKRTGVVIHTRSLNPIRAHNLEHRTLVAWIDLAAKGSVVVDRIDAGIEIRARGRDPGTASMWLLSNCKEATLGVVISDDHADERAFEVIGDFGFGIRVGESERPSVALGRLSTCGDVATFLEKWLLVSGEKT